MVANSTPAWSLILAGGDGVRLRPLTSQITGDGRPKQFCPILDSETLLERTRRRVDLLCRADRQLVVVTQAHEPYYRYLVAELAPGRLVVQPENRGTGPGILYPLLKLRELAGDVPVAIFPSDHHIPDDRAFMAVVESALDIVRRRTDLIVLLGIEPDRPETEYGWIETGDVPLPIGDSAFPIRRFWEKPSSELAQRLLEDGCLWNSFVMVGWLATFVALIGETAPELLAAFKTLRVGTPDERVAVERIYASLSPVSFSDQVLAFGCRRLATVRVNGLEWSDWGNPGRVLASLARAGRTPSWLGRVALAGTA